MGQMIFVDKDEFEANKWYANAGKEYIEMVDKLSEVMYPEITYWIDTGNTFQAHRVFYEKVLKDWGHGYKWSKSKPKRSFWDFFFLKSRN